MYVLVITAKFIFMLITLQSYQATLVKRQRPQSARLRCWIIIINYLLLLHLTNL